MSGKAYRLNGWRDIAPTYKRAVVLALMALFVLISVLGVAVGGTFAATTATASLPARQDKGFEQDQGQTQGLKQPSVPIGGLLNKDGTLNLHGGFRGSVDPTGWKMETGKDGQPRFVRAGDIQLKTRPASAFAPLDPGDENWDNRFSSLGANTFIRAIAVSGTDVYVGGDFTTVGALSASRIAKWDGSQWFALGGGVSGGSVYGIAINGTDVYASGRFTSAGGNSAPYIAKWNGSSWSALGTGLNNFAYQVAVSGTDVYVCGLFTQAGGSSANRIAKWNGSSWSALGSPTNGVNNNAYALAISGSNLYVAGDLTQAGGNSANYIARWDGSSWSSLGTGLNLSALALAASGSDLYVAGDFTAAGTCNPCNHIAKWTDDGGHTCCWSALGSGLNSHVRAVAASGGVVYAGGEFTLAGGISAPYIAKWDGSSWSSLGGGLDNFDRAIAVSGLNMYAGGQFTTAGNKPSNYFGLWHLDPQPTYTPTATDTPTSTLTRTQTNTPTITPTPTAIPTNTPTATLTRTSTNTLTNTPTNTLTNTPTATPTCGSGWNLVSSLNSSGDNYLVSVAAVTANDIWAVGYYNNPWQTLIEHWNGSAWTIKASPNQGSSSNYLLSIAVVSASDIWAVGYYYNGSVNQTLVEHWNGTSWTVVPSPNVGGGNNELDGVAAVSAGDVWAVGHYQNGSISRTLVEHWDSTSWSVVPSPNDGASDNALNGVAAVSDNNIWAVGYSLNGSIPQTLTMQWDGSIWSVVPSPDPGSSGYLTGVAAVSAGDVWAVGYSLNGSIPQTLMVHWDGSAWGVVPNPNVGSSTNYLMGVAAVSGSDVWTVGWYDNGSFDQTLTEHWSGTAWNIVSSPNSNSNNNILYGVAAASASDVWTVGYYQNNTISQTLAERYSDRCATPTNTPTITSTPTSTSTRTSTSTPTDVTVTIVDTATHQIPAPVPSVVQEVRIPFHVTGPGPNGPHILHPSDTYVVSRVEVLGLNISYTVPSSIGVNLISPAGTIVNLFGGICGTQVWTDQNTGFNVADSAQQPMGSVCPPGQSPYKPQNCGTDLQGCLAQFIGEPIVGDWTLDIVVGAGNGGGIGGMNACGLSITARCADCPTPTATITPLAYITTTTYMSGDVNRGIPAQGAISSTLAVGGLRPADVPHVSGVEVVGLNISHGSPSDLSVSLVSPSGIAVPLFSNVCAGIAWNASNTGFNLMDGAARALGESCPPNRDDFRAQGSLAALVRQQGSGTWTLRVTNGTSSSVGVLTAWGLRITTTDCPSCPTVTSTSTRTPTSTPSWTATPASILVGHVTWQGPPAQPNARQQQPITLTLKLGATEINYPVQTTDASGFFTVSVVGLANGTYSWRMKNPKYLANIGSLSLAGVQRTAFEGGQMKAGDANNDNRVTATDFTIVKGSFGKSAGQQGYDDRADFSGDSIVNATDFNLVKNNFGQGGGAPIRPGP